MKQELRTRINRIIVCLIFLLLVGCIFGRMTYLFRNTGRDARMNLVGFYDEPKKSLDVVMVGGSSVYLYWDPIEAWKQYGFTSYDYATASAAAAAMIPMIEEVEKRQNPQVIVCDVRRLLSTNLDTQVDMSLQNVLDSMDLSWSRLKGVNYFRKVNGLTWEEIAPELFEIIAYHDNQEALSTKEHWELADNRSEDSLDREGTFKGFTITAKHTLFTDEPQMTEALATLDPVAERIFRDLLEYCSKKNIVMQPISAPFLATEQEQMEINEMSRIAAEYGYDFWDGNRYMEEIGLDTSSDYYNDNHVNAIGAKKYTDYLGRYLLDRYGIVSNKSEKVQEAWNALTQEYALAMENAEGQIVEMQADKEVCLEKEAQMLGTEDLHTYFSLGNDPYITLFAIAAEPTEKWLTEKDEFYVTALGLEQRSLYAGAGLAVYNKGSVYASDMEERHTGYVGEQYLRYEMVRGEAPSLIINGQEYYLSGREACGEAGLLLVAFDDCYHRVFDRVLLTMDEEGMGRLVHLEP